MQKFFFVHWENCPASQDSWVPQDDLNPAQVKAFEKEREEYLARMMRASEKKRQKLFDPDCLCGNKLLHQAEPELLFNTCCGTLVHQTCHDILKANKAIYKAMGDLTINCFCCNKANDEKAFIRVNFLRSQ